MLAARELRSATLFGSCARAEARPNSDIDILVDDGGVSRPLSVYAFGEDPGQATEKRVEVFEVSELDGGPSAAGRSGKELGCERSRSVIGYDACRRWRSAFPGSTTNTMSTAESIVHM